MRETKGGFTQEYLDKLTFREFNLWINTHNQVIEEINEEINKSLKR